MNSSETPNGFSSIAADCKFCKRHLLIKIDPSGAGTPMFDIGKLVKLATCNKCADYYEKVRTLGETIIKGAFRSSYVKKPDEKQRIRDALILLTKRYAEIVCTHFNRVTVWEPDFVEDVLKHHGKVDVILKAYRKMIASL